MSEGYAECLGADFTCDDVARFEDCARVVENALVECPLFSTELENRVNDCVFAD